MLHLDGETSITNFKALNMLLKYNTQITLTPSVGPD